MFEKLFNIKIYWNYFATSHGKGCIDGITATTKMIVRKHIRSRDCVVNNSTDFVKAFNMTTSQIAIEEVSERDIDEINVLMIFLIFFIIYDFQRQSKFLSYFYLRIPKTLSRIYFNKLSDK